MGADALLSRLGKAAAAEARCRHDHARRVAARRAPAGLGASGPAGETEAAAPRLAAAAVSTLTALPPWCALLVLKS
jgi:hypothetical protein